MVLGAVVDRTINNRKCVEQGGGVVVMLEHIKDDHHESKAVNTTTTRHIHGIKHRFYEIPTNYMSSWQSS